MGLGDQLDHVPPLRRAAGHRPRQDPRAAVAEPPGLPAYGYVVRRRELDQLVADNAVKAGATLWQGTEALAPADRAGVRARRRRPAQGRPRPRRRSGPGTWSWPTAPTPASGGRWARRATRSGRTARPSGATGGARSRRAVDRVSCLDVKDRNGNPMPGYGWIFPVGDGTVNIGVGLLSTFRDFKGVNTTNLLREYVATAPDYWELEPDAAGGPPDQRPAAHGRLGRPEGRADAPRGGRRRRHRQPVQRRGHRLRLRDRAHGRRGAPRGHPRATTRSCCSSTRSASRPSTASTSRSPGCSPT